MTFESFLFFFVAIVAVVSALMMITRPNPIKGVLFLIVNFFCLSVLYLLLQAQFIAIIQILVYAGAIMVLFLFVLMLLNLQDEKMLQEKKNFRRFVAIGLSAGMLVGILGSFGLTTGVKASAISAETAQLGTVESIGRVLFREYLLPFEITSVLLLA